VIYHVVTAERWAAAGDPYLPETYSRDGYIHCSEDFQIEDVANERYADEVRLNVLEIDERLLPAPVKRENLHASGDRYPHIYGPIPRSAVNRVLPLLRGADGRLRLPLGAVPGAVSSSELVVRRASAEDATLIARFRCDMFRDMHPEKDYSGVREALQARNEDFHLRHAEDPDYVTFLVVSPEGPVGCASLMIEEKPPHADFLRNFTGYVLSVFVEPAYRGRGAARALMERIHEEAAARGVARLSLHASRYGKPLYLSMGYRPNPEFLEMKL
jgi:uncharacterized protein (DUF952 family)/GNAT superfamily N-acetyltransferase